MLCYSDEQIRLMLQEILRTERFTFTSIGNHLLPRHRVYRVLQDGMQPVVFKIYYKTGRRSREIAALQLLRDSEVRCPRVLASGELADGHEWLMIEHLAGDTYEQVKEHIPRDNQLQIFEAMGEELGKIHGYRTFEYCGNWDETGQPVNATADYYGGFLQGLESVRKEIERQKLFEEALLLKALEHIRTNAYMLKDIKEFRLRHNDFDGRNVLVQQEGDYWVLSAVIDFEQSTPGNAESDLIPVYQKYFRSDRELEECFLLGYRKYSVLEEGFFRRLNLYLLYDAVGTCSWAMEQAPHYYREVIKLVEQMMAINSPG